MSPRLSWSSLVPGLIALGLLVALAAGIIMFAGIGRLDGKTIRLHVVTNQAHGLMKGSDVWLSGQRVGIVTDIEFLPPASDTATRVVVVMDVVADDAAQIRRDSDVQIRAGANVIGPIVVYVTAGTRASPRVGDGDTLRARSQSDFQSAGTKLADATAQFGPIVADAKAALARVRDTSGTVGAALSGSSAGEVARLRSSISRLRAQLDGGGSADVATLMATSRRALARVDSVRTLLASPNTSYGRFKRDSTLGDVVAGVRDELAELRSRMWSDEGTLGRLARDSAIVLQITNAQREMTELFADIRRRPMRYIAF